MSYFHWNTKELLDAYAECRFPTKATAQGHFFLFEPQRRAVLPVSGMHVSRTLAQKLRRDVFRISFDTAFLDVIHSCTREKDNWITPPLIRMYEQAYREGWAHSVECWDGVTLVGGMYGLAIGSVFYVESMFSNADDASKIACFYLLEECRKQGFEVIDVQFISTHLESLGAFEMDSASFRAAIKTAVNKRTAWGSTLVELKETIGVPRSFFTERLCIKRFSPKDAGSLLAWHNDPNVHRYTLVEPLAHADEAARYIEKAMGSYQYGIPDPLAICLKEDPGSVIGTIGCFRPQTGLPTFELAFDLAPEFWGKGLIVEAGKAMIDVAFKSLPMERLQARCVTQNEASHRVLEKLGMTFEGILRSAMYHQGRSWDMQYFSLLRSDRSS